MLVLLTLVDGYVVAYTIWRQRAAKERPLQVKDCLPELALLAQAISYTVAYHV